MPLRLEGRAEPTIDPCFARPPGPQKDVQKSAEEQLVKNALATGEFSD